MGLLSTNKRKVVDLVFIRQWLNAQINSHKHMIETNKQSVLEYRWNDQERMAQWCEGRIAGYQMALRSFEDTLENLERLATYEK